MHLKRNHFASTVDVQDAVTRDPNIIPKQDFSRTLGKLKERANKCIECTGGLFEQKICQKKFCNFFVGSIETALTLIMGSTLYV